MYMIKNRWKNTEFYCMNHKKPVRFQEYTASHTPFYACPKYFLKDENHPDGHDEDEKQCLNRISTTLAWSIIEQISAMVEDAHKNSELIDFKNCCFPFKGYDVTILELNEYSNRVKIGINAQREAAGWKQL